MNLWHFTKNQLGSALIWSLLAASMISGGAGYLLSQKKTVKEVVNTLDFENQKQLFDLFLKANLINVMVCNENFAGHNVNGTYTTIRNNTRDILQVNNFYSVGKLFITGIQTQAIAGSTTDFNLIITYEKRKDANTIDSELGGKHFRKVYRMGGAILADGTVEYCHMNENGEITNLVDPVATQLCRGPGVIGGPTECKVIEIESTGAACPLGQTSTYTYNSVTGNWGPSCQSIFEQIGTNNQQCPFGLRVVNNNIGAFECFDMASLVDETKVAVTDNSVCGIKTNSTTGMISFSCNITPPPPPTGSCNNLPVQNSCQPGTVNGFNYNQCPNVVRCGCLGTLKCVNTDAACLSMGGCLDV